MDAHDASSNFFAAELFQDVPDPATGLDNPLNLVGDDHDTTMQEMDDFGGIEPSFMGAGMKTEDDMKNEHLDNEYPSLDDAAIPPPDFSIMDMVEESFAADDASARDASAQPQPSSHKKSGRSKIASTEADLKSSIHSSKNEGQHTDRRFLCYLCNKLFTRRRSVRDHISKIHNTKTWEPRRSLEVIVDPVTGEPLESIDDIVSRGPPEHPSKASKSDKSGQEKDHTEAKDLGVAMLHGEEDPSQDPEPAAASPPPAAAVANLKKEPSLAGSRASSTEPFASPAQVVGKKRPAPEDAAKPHTAATRKKGTAKVKSTTSNKRSKLAEPGHTPPSAHSTYRSPSATPASTHLRLVPSKLKKHTSAASVRSSPTPDSSRAASVDVGTPSSTAETSSSSNDDGEVFCICRKGDNHTWMIACDGGCEEWFHGNCVNIRERDGDLIDKYICPTCKRPGLQTTWKRMCRRKACRKPARVTQVPPSKYCSDACGRKFFVEMILRSDPNAQASEDGLSIIEPVKPKKLRKKIRRRDAPTKALKAVARVVNGELGDDLHPDSRLATPAYSDDEKSEYETDSSLDADELPNTGGPLRAGEIKAIMSVCKTIEEFKGLGKRPETPPRDLDGDGGKPSAHENDDLELAKLASIAAEKRQLNERKDMLTGREVLLDLVQARSASITDEVKKNNPKMKDICGFDPRTAWCDSEFATWYHQRGGKAILDAAPSAKIGPPDSLDEEANGANGVDDADDEYESEKMPKKGGVCVKNRCSRHRNWVKSQLAELRFEEDLVRRALARCDAQESVLRERAMVRAWEKGTA